MKPEQTIKIWQKLVRKSKDLQSNGEKTVKRLLEKNKMKTRHQVPIYEYLPQLLKALSKPIILISNTNDNNDTQLFIENLRVTNKTKIGQIDVISTACKILVVSIYR